MDINPLVLMPTGEGGVALDARMTLAPRVEDERGERRCPTVVTLYVMSMEQFSGKTAVCLGLASQDGERGIRVGYMKPVAMALKSAERHGRGCLADEALPATSKSRWRSSTPVVIDGRALERIYSREGGRPRLEGQRGIQVRSPPAKT